MPVTIEQNQETYLSFMHDTPEFLAVGHTTLVVSNPKEHILRNRGVVACDRVAWSGQDCDRMLHKGRGLRRKTTADHQHYASGCYCPASVTANKHTNSQ